MTTRNMARCSLPFGQTIKAAREKAGYTQAQLAQQIGVATSYISIVETARQPPPSNDTIERMIYILDVGHMRDELYGMIDRVPDDILMAYKEDPVRIGHVIRNKLYLDV